MKPRKTRHCDERMFALITGKPQKVGTCAHCDSTFKTSKHMHCTLCEACRNKYGRNRR